MSKRLVVLFLAVVAAAMWSPRLRAARGKSLAIRFAVTPESDWLYGINISNWPVGYESHDAAPIEIEIR